MTTRQETVIASYDAFVSQDTPNKNFGGRTNLWVRENDPHSYRTYVYFPVDKAKYEDATILSAILSLYHLGSNPSGTLAFRRVTQKWREGGISWNDSINANTGSELQANLVSANDKERIDIDLTAIMQSWASGAAVYGVRIHAISSGSWKFYSSEAAQRLQPKLRIQWTPPPDAPTNLRPGGGKAVAAAAPLLLWDSDTPTSVHVQIADADDFSNVIFDSDWVVQDEEQYDTALDPVPPSLADDTEYWWRSQIQDDTFQPSAYSVGANFERRSKGSLNITSPGSTVATTSPTITFTFTGRTQESVEYELLEDGNSIYTRPRAAQAATSFDLPNGLIKSGTSTYTIIVRVWDRFDRAGTDGDAYVEDSQDFTFGTNNAITGVSSLAGATVDGHLLLTWSRASAPDFFAVRANGEYLYDRIEAADVSTGGTGYALKFWDAPPQDAVTYVVEAVVLTSGVYQHSQTNPSAIVTFAPIGIWLTDPDQQIEVHIMGDEDADAALGETGETFFPLGRKDPVRLIDNVRGLEGSISGTLITIGSRSAAFEYAGMAALKSDPLATRRLTFGYINIPVLLGEVHLPPTPIPEENYDVSFEFWQIDEFLS